MDGLKTMAVSLLLVLVVAIGITDRLAWYKCLNYQTVTGTLTKWVFMDTCYVQVGTGTGTVWQRWDEYLARSTASDLNHKTNRYMYAH